jgi:hypothetical protein
MSSGLAQETGAWTRPLQDGRTLLGAPHRKDGIAAQGHLENHMGVAWAKRRWRLLLLGIHHYEFWGASSHTWQAAFRFSHLLTNQQKATRSQKTHLELC